MINILQYCSKIVTTNSTRESILYYDRNDIVRKKQPGAEHHFGNLVKVLMHEAETRLTRFLQYCAGFECCWGILAGSPPVPPGHDIHQFFSLLIYYTQISHTLVAYAFYLSPLEMTSIKININ